MEEDADCKIQWITKEGGLELMNFLLAKASSGSVPEQFCDLIKLNLEKQDHWHKACLKELSALKK